MARAVSGRDRHDDRLGGDVAAVGADGDGAVGVPLDAPDDRVQPNALTQLVGQPQRDLLGAAGEAVLLRAALARRASARSRPRP